MESERGKNAVAAVTNIQGYSIHDGPGIRTAVFLKGCPLRCRWCANPENLSGRIEIGFLERLCSGCGKCFSVCGSGAIARGEGVYRIERKKCTVCGECVRACHYGALVRYGEEMTAAEVYEQVKRDKLFYDSSGGGVTVSGGEPLTQTAFVAELFRLLKADGIGTCVETCGEASAERFEELAPVTDYFLFDLKQMDAEIHKAQTGVSNERILDNARRLSGGGADILFRLPLVPGVNDGEENTERTAAFLKGLGRGKARLQLMPYHRMGQAKYAALQLDYPTENVPVMSAAEVDAAARAYRELGVDCTVSR